jgi:4-hydroxybenzoyl-CoA thioesterase
MLTVTRTVRVEFGDCDPSGIVFNPRYYEWFDASLHALLRGAGLSFDGLRAEYGIDGIPLVENRCKFSLPCRYGEEVAIETAVVAVHRCAFELRHRVMKGDAVAVEVVETRVWTALDAAAGRPRARPLPPRVVELLNADAAPVGP